MKISIMAIMKVIENDDENSISISENDENDIISKRKWKKNERRKWNNNR